MSDPLDLVARAKRNDLGARDELLRRYEPLVRVCARRWFSVQHDSPADLDDLLQEARIALIELLGIYDPSRGKFSSFAFRRIHWKLRIHWITSRTVVRIPKTLRDRFFSQRDRHPSEVSIDALTESGARVVDTLEADALAADDALAEAEHGRSLRAEVSAALTALHPRDRETIELRLMADAPTSRTVIGRRWGVTRQRIEQRETQAIKKLRVLLAAHDIKAA